MNKHLALLIITFIITLIIGLGKVWLIGFWIIFIIVFIGLEFIVFLYEAFRGAKQIGQFIGQKIAEEKRKQNP